MRGLSGVSVGSLWGLYGVSIIGCVRGLCGVSLTGCVRDLCEVYIGSIWGPSYRLRGLCERSIWGPSYRLCEGSL